MCVSLLCYPRHTHKMCCKYTTAPTPAAPSSLLLLSCCRCARPTTKRRRNDLQHCTFGKQPPQHQRGELKKLSLNLPPTNCQQITIKRGIPVVPNPNYVAEFYKIRYKMFHSSESRAGFSMKRGDTHPTFVMEVVSETECSTIGEVVRFPLLFVTGGGASRMKMCSKCC